MSPRKRQSVATFAPVLRSPEMRKVDRIVRAVAAKDVILTLVGESGCGKEVLARRAHELSERRHGPFIPINCAAIPEALFESELFGHERGAFTGASARARGKIEAAEGGTLFFDEIGELPVTMQAKLLRFLESLRFMRVGGVTKIEANVRLMFATLRPLDEDVRAGRFRADLFYRIQGITVRVPPLRERRADIAPLLATSVDELSARHGVSPPRLSRAARAALLSYDWPGNVRELRNVVGTLCLLRGGKQVRPSDLPEVINQHRSAPASLRAASEASPLQLELDDGLPRLVEQIIHAALHEERGSAVRAAARLKVSARTVQRYLAAGRVQAAK